MPLQRTAQVTAKKAGIISRGCFFLACAQDTNTSHTNTVTNQSVRSEVRRAAGCALTVRSADTGDPFNMEENNRHNFHNQAQQTTEIRAEDGWGSNSGPGRWETTSERGEQPQGRKAEAASVLPRTGPTPGASLLCDSVFVRMLGECPCAQLNSSSCALSVSSPQHPLFVAVS